MRIQPDDLKRKPLGRRPAQIQHGFLQDQAAAHERPFATLDLDQLIGQQLIVDHPVLDEDAGVDRLDRHHLPRWRSEREEVAEMDRAAYARDGSERRREVEIGGREVARGGNLATRAPIDPALPADRPVHERHDALGQARELVRLEAGPECEARDVQRGMAGAGRQPMLDRNIGHQRPRMLKRAGRPHFIACEREMHIVAFERIEAWVCVAIGDGERAVDAEVAVMDAPAARCIAEKQRDVPDGRPGAAELAADARARKVAGQMRGIEQDRRIRLAEPHSQTVHAEDIADDPSTRGGEMQR